jgi:hypothetical protein
MRRNTQEELRKDLAFLLLSSTLWDLVNNDFFQQFRMCLDTMIAKQMLCAQLQKCAACFVYCEIARNEQNATKHWLNSEREIIPNTWKGNGQTNWIAFNATQHTRRAEKRSWNFWSLQRNTQEELGKSCFLINQIGSRTLACVFVSKRYFSLSCSEQIWNILGKTMIRRKKHGKWI